MTGEESRGKAVTRQGVGHRAVLVYFGGELASFVAYPCPDHAEVQFGLLCALQDELETGFALVGHSILVVSLQDPLLLQGEHRAEVHSLQAAPLSPGIHPAAAAGGERSRHAGHKRSQRRSHDSQNRRGCPNSQSGHDVRGQVTPHF